MKGYNIKHWIYDNSWFGELELVGWLVVCKVLRHDNFSWTI